MRWLVAIAAVSAVLATTAAMAQPDDNGARANRGAYQAAMKCFVVNGRARGVASRAGDTDAAAHYEASGHRAFDAAIRLGETLGLPGDQMQEDFGFAQTKELPPLVADRAYYRQAVADCRALGLM